MTMIMMMMTYAYEKGCKRMQLVVTSTNSPKTESRYEVAHIKSIRALLAS